MMQALNENWGACDVVLILHELHQRGYEQLRLHCGWSPNGLSWRWNIYPKCLMGKDAKWEQHNDYTPIDCPHGSVGSPKCEVDYSRAADVLLRSDSELLELGKLPDEEYIHWYAQLVEHAKRGEFPVAFSEYFPSPDSWLFEPSQEKLPYPPFTPTIKKRRKPLRFSIKNSKFVSDFAKKYSGGEWFWTRYVGHLYGAIALDFDSESGWLVFQPYRKNEDDRIDGVYTYILINHDRVVVYRSLSYLDKESSFSPADTSWILYDELLDTLDLSTLNPTSDSRLTHCRYYDGQTEPDMDNGFDEYYFAMAEKFYVNRVHKEDERHCLELLTSLHLEDLQGEVPLELLAQLFMTCDHILQKGSWKPCPLEHVAEYFRTKFFPKYMSGRK